MAECCVRTLDSVKIREAFPALKEVIYLNVGTYGIMPEPALQATVEALTEFERRGVAHQADVGGKAYRTRQRIAELLGVPAETVAMTTNASDGNTLALGAIDWRPSDEVITTDEEHEAMAHPLLWLQNHKGVVIRRLSVSPEPEVMLGRLDGALTPRTRLVAMSHVTCETGTRLPAREVCAWARERGILSHLDGAQVLGAFPVDLREVGCDTYASNGHKWLCGPKGTGVFYADRSRLSQMVLGQVESGTRAWPLWVGLGASLDWFEGLGWENVAQHIAQLSGYLKERVPERPYLRLLTPRAFEQSSGLASLVVDGHVAGEVSRELREKWHIHVRVVPHFNALRVSTAHFNTEADIDAVMEALEAISRQ
jgi:selenocysteine lyase/cysteine desulfurase